jgi:anti-sigma regulatory factor (Ser/Thr protein kinase)
MSPALPEPIMAKIDLAQVTTWITALVHAHPTDLAKALSERCECSATRTRKLIHQLEEMGWLKRLGTPRQPRFAAGMMRQIVKRYPIHGLDEDLPWSRDFAPHFDVPANVRQMMQHAFTELLNNAIDHSEGSTVTLSMRQTAAHVQLLVSDDGRGLFDKIREGFSIEDPAMAMLELSKGRLTSSPERHTGRGLFFTSRLADVFDLHANSVAFLHREWDPRQWTRGRAVRPAGSSIYLAIALDTTRTLDQVLRSASEDGASYGIEHTRLPLRLLVNEDVALESRSQARKVASRLGQFKQAELDFDGVDHIGQGFADELFRVFARNQQGVQLVVRNAGRNVQSMIEMAQAA